MRTLLYVKGEQCHTVIFFKSVSKKASSCARFFKTSSSLERLMSIVRAFLAMGYRSCEGGVSKVSIERANIGKAS